MKTKEIYGHTFLRHGKTEIDLAELASLMFGFLFILTFLLSLGLIILSVMEGVFKPRLLLIFIFPLFFMIVGLLLHRKSKPSREFSDYINSQGKIKRIWFDEVEVK